ncbi:MAG: hypothetical protein ACXW3C_03010 [Pyrinomonadaceae bacterium]
MKRTLLKWFGIAVMAGAITFSLIQVRMPVAKADGCPSQPFFGCVCDLTNIVVVDYGGGQTSTTCYYSCGCGGGSGGGEFFVIEREYTY